ncbi:hypothetical protein HDV64DRAFT_262065 [Trichoderma sp. TUCIM 5745]
MVRRHECLRDWLAVRPSQGGGVAQNSQEPRRQQQFRGSKLQERGGSSSRAWEAAREDVLGVTLALAKILKLCCWRRARDSSGMERAKDLPKEKMR